jgi:hypothetical protein
LSFGFPLCPPSFLSDLCGLLLLLLLLLLFPLPLLLPFSFSQRPLRLCGKGSSLLLLTSA